MNDNTPVPIEPSVITQVKTLTSFRVIVQDLTLFTSVNLRVELFGENNSFLDLRYVQLIDDDYKNWNNDDNYIIQKVAEKLGLIIKPTEPTQP